MRFKVVFLLLLVFASTFIAGVVTTGISLLVSCSPNAGNVINNVSMVQPLGDPIDIPGPPHAK